MGFSRFIFLKVWNSNVEYQLKGRQKKIIVQNQLLSGVKVTGFPPTGPAPAHWDGLGAEENAEPLALLQTPRIPICISTGSLGDSKHIELEKCFLRQGSRPWLHPATTSGSGRDPQGWVAPERLLGLVCGAHGIRVLEATPLPKAENHYPKVVAGSPQLFLRLADHLCSVRPYSNAPSPPQAIPRDCPCFPFSGRWLLSLGIFSIDPTEEASGWLCTRTHWLLMLTINWSLYIRGHQLSNKRTLNKLQNPQCSYKSEPGS